MIIYGIKNIEKSIIDDGKYTDDFKKLKKDKIKGKYLKTLKYIYPYLIDTALSGVIACKAYPFIKEDPLIALVIGTSALVSCASIYGITISYKETVGYSYSKFSKDCDNIDKNYMENVFELSRKINKK